MAVGTSAMCGTFKREILAGIHRLTAHTRTGSSAISADTLKVAMFTNSSSIDLDTTGYTTQLFPRLELDLPQTMLRTPQ